ncbi:lysoplasmalogenase [Hyphomonas sp.]|uniref:lysoplasmalogenase n=1 Tax=Hyphomonas sp. TaxID=87 RepID=UPI003F70D389
MTGGEISLYGALALGALYGAGFCYRGKGPAGLVVKTGSTALLALWAYLAGGPALLVAALALSSLGDLFLALEGEHWLKPGMAAFFLAHVAYVVLFWELASEERTLPVLAAQVVLVFGGAFFVRWLSPYLGVMRVPVFAYAAVILVMGAAALRLHTAYWLVTLGAVMFIASDAILSLQLFRKPADEPAGIAPSLAVWFLYFGGQALIAWGMLGAAL